jgi:hypothetical protein
MLVCKNASGIIQMNLRTFVENRTFFLFFLSTITPASMPNNNEGSMKERTTPETAVFECTTVKATIRRTKFSMFIAS